jgi:exopolyphosphatase / guanosine-5'-triphosphate,3'-diphosphate pyrophosphatase
VSGPIAGRAAAVDVGSTSVHLLVADVAGEGLEPVLDLSELLMFGALIGAHGMFGPEARGELSRVLAVYAAEARRLGAVTIAFVGTDPLRHAADAARACLQAERASGIPVHVIDQAEEGALTLLGVTGGSVHDRLTVIDIGGGSTEIIQADAGGLGEVVGLPLGASRLSTLVGADDPPTADQVAALRREADRVVAAAPDLAIGETIAVGGTAYGVARVATGPGIGERVVDADGIALAVAISGRERSTQVAELFGLNPRRARILPAGAAILAALAARYGFDRIRASEQGIREGLVRAILADPIAWRDRLGRFATSNLG